MLTVLLSEPMSKNPTVPDMCSKNKLFKRNPVIKYWITKMQITKKACKNKRIACKISNYECLLWAANLRK